MRHDGLHPHAAPGATDDELLCELAGREIDRQHAHAALLWLRATHVRLRAEAARQGKLTGALCTPGEWNDPDTYAALQTALAPTHLSALPLWGAWWAGSHFSATLFAFLERETDGLTAHVTLEDEQGNVVEQLTRPCPPAGGDLGVLRATLPGSPCALTLCTKLTQGDSVVEQSQIPVYVGLRGVLEGAF